MLTRSQFMRKAALGAAFLLLSRLRSAIADEAAERDLIVSAINGSLDGVRRALKDGASIDVRDNRGRTALLIATHPTMSRLRGC